MSMDSDCSLCSDFFVFNSKLSKNEDDEDKKILFYHPSPTPLSQQHISIGLCEAVIHFVEFAILFSLSLHSFLLFTKLFLVLHTDRSLRSPFNLFTRRSELSTCILRSLMYGG